MFLQELLGFGNRRVHNLHELGWPVTYLDDAHVRLVKIKKFRLGFPQDLRDGDGMTKYKIQAKIQLASN